MQVIKPARLAAARQHGGDTLTKSMTGGTLTKSTRGGTLTKSMDDTGRGVVYPDGSEIYEP